MIRLKSTMCASKWRIAAAMALVLAAAGTLAAFTLEPRETVPVSIGVYPSEVEIGDAALMLLDVSEQDPDHVLLSYSYNGTPNVSPLINPIRAIFTSAGVGHFYLQTNPELNLSTDLTVTVTAGNATQQRTDTFKINAPD